MVALWSSLLTLDQVFAPCVMGFPCIYFSIRSLFFELPLQRLLTEQMVFDGVLLSPARQTCPINLPFVFVHTHTRGSAYIDGSDWTVGGLARVPARSQSR